MLVTKSFLAEGGWVYLASAVGAVVLMLLRALGQARAGTAAAVLIVCTFVVGSWFTASYANAVDEVGWGRPGEPSTRVLYERCVAAGRLACHVEYRQMDYYLEHRLLGVYAPLACGAALGVLMLLTRRRAASEDGQ